MEFRAAMWQWLCCLQALLAAGLDVSPAGLAKRPLCQSRNAWPPVSGFLSQDNLVLDAGCRYRIFESQDAAKCLGGNWMVIMGSSNTLLEFNNLVDFFAPAEFVNQRKGKLIGSSAVVDVVILHEKVIHWKQMGTDVMQCKQYDWSKAEALGPQCKAHMQSLLHGAPAHVPGAIRITFFLTLYWYRAGLAMDVVKADQKWKKAELGFVLQVGAWYMYCSQLKAQWCPRKELTYQDMWNQGMQTYQTEMKSMLGQMKGACHGPRTSRLGCNVQTVSWSNGGNENAIYMTMNEHVREYMHNEATDSFRLVDFGILGKVMQHEIVEGHGSQLLNLWMWTVMFNVMCPAELASPKTHAAFSGTMCRASEMSWGKCQHYQHTCTQHLFGSYCMKWACLNAAPCTLSARGPQAKTT